MRRTNALPIALYRASVTRAVVPRSRSDGADRANAAFAARLLERARSIATVEGPWASDPRGAGGDLADLFAPVTAPPAAAAAADPAARELAAADAALELGRLATRSLLAMFGPDEDRGRGSRASGDDGFASLFAGFGDDLAAKLRAALAARH